MEDLNILCYWLQVKDNWRYIANLMGHSTRWVKRRWSKILKREKITTGDNMKQDVKRVMETLMAEAVHSNGFRTGGKTSNAFVELIGTHDTRIKEKLHKLSSDDHKGIEMYNSMEESKSNFFNKIRYEFHRHDVYNL